MSIVATPINTGTDRNIFQKYARLLVHYCLEVNPGEKIHVRSTWLAQPLLQEVQKEILKAGAFPHFSIEFEDQEAIFLEYAKGDQLDYVSPFHRMAIEEFDGFVFIRAPFNTRSLQDADPEKTKRAKAAQADLSKTYMQRTATRELKRNLCQFPTAAAAQEANMSLTEYEQFVFDACFLNDEDPIQSWLKVREQQQAVVDLLNEREFIRYRSEDFDISFKTTGRIWMNSDGQTNMPSGEVYTSPVEDSVNGVIRFSFPGIFMGREIEDITLTVKDGKVVKWEAKQGKELLDEVLAMNGARYFGEAAIGTNYNIQRHTRNMLFDEKIGGTIHMALGQSYLQTGGKNMSDIHWDLLADMRKGGEIYADGELIYKDGDFIF